MLRVTGTRADAGLREDGYRYHDANGQDSTVEFCKAEWIIEDG